MSYELPPVLPIASAQTESGGFAESHILPGSEKIELVLLQPGEHRIIIPLTMSGAKAVIQVLTKALEVTQ